jgi:sulfatase modifying factor 1
MTDCGSAKESCCASLPVAGGTFYRTYTTTGCSPMGEADPATVSSFRLDKYDVTVGRFRQFVSAWNGGWMPTAGSGKHTHLNGGQGLTNNGPQGGYEPGWVTADNSNIALTTANLTSCMGSNLTNDFKLIPYSSNTWTDTPTTQENLPMVCVNWYEAYAFCIWDGDFLPSEAEWEYAAAGGNQQREYPWGPTDPGRANRYAIYNCDYPMPSVVCTDVSKIAPVGTTTLGAGRWGQLDLAGNVYQWNMDAYAAYYAACTDCVALDSPPLRTARGGAFTSSSSFLRPTDPGYEGPAGDRRSGIGLRCARAP